MQNLTHEKTSEAKKVLLMLNSSARQGHKHQEAIETWLTENNYSLIHRDSQDEQSDFAKCIERYHETAEIVVVGGGDGSLNGALPALMKHQLPVLVLPLGTANNLAHSLNIPKDLNEALKLLQTGQIQKIDVGIANEIPFLCVVGLGLSTQVNHFVESGMKRWAGPFAFIWTALKVLRRMNPFTVILTCDGVVHRAKSWQISICNGIYYGTHLKIHEEATLTDKRLHAVSSEMRRWWEGLLLIPQFILGRYQDSKSLSFFSGQNMRIETRRPMRVDIDGDIKTRTPVDISVRPEALRIFVPKPVPAETPIGGLLIPFS